MSHSNINKGSQGDEKKPFLSKNDNDDDFAFDSHHPEKYENAQLHKDEFNQPIKLGQDDLFPGGTGSPEGGSLMGPEHPIFGPPITDPFSNQLIQKQQDEKGNPKAAHFDPPDPFHPSPSKPYGPNPDHLKPPQFGSNPGPKFF